VIGVEAPFSLNEPVTRPPESCLSVRTTGPSSLRPTNLPVKLWASARPPIRMRTKAHPLTFIRVPFLAHSIHIEGPCGLRFDKATFAILLIRDKLTFGWYRSAFVPVTWYRLRTLRAS